MAHRRASAKRLPASSVLEEERPSKRPCYDHETIITILVGRHEHRFAAHKDVICAKSEFFRAACSTCWLEGRDKVVRLPEVDPDVFSTYLDWTYTDVLVVETAPKSPAVKTKTSRGIVDMYLLGDVLNDIKLRNRAMQLLSSHVINQRVPNTMTIRRIWDNTPSTSLLRNWVVDVLILKLSREYFVKNAATYPPELVLQVATRLLWQTEKLDNNDLEEKMSSSEYLEPEDDT